MRNLNEFYQYMLQFYGPDSDIYPEYSFTVPEITAATLQHIKSGADFAADSWDREQIRDLIIQNRNSSVEDHSPFATVNS
jgi:hypothetical protein